MSGPRATRGKSGPAPVDVDVFSTLIGDIYECALDPRGWPDVLARVCQAIGGNAGWVAVHVPDRISSTYQIEAGTDPEWQRRLREDYVGSSPFIGITHHMCGGDIFSVADVVDYTDFQAGRFYREWASPQGWPDLIFAVLARETDRFSFLGVCLPDRATPANKQAAGRFLPHLDRALRILDLIGGKDSELADLADAVGLMSTGVILVDGQMKVRGINPAARRVLPVPPGGQLRASDPRTTQRLRTAVEGCAAGAIGQDGLTEVILADDERRLTVHVVPLPRAESRELENRAVAAFFITDPDRPASLPVTSLAQRFGLTPSELRVALALLDGKTPAAIAAMQGVSLATVRTHLRRLYEKTGTGGQAALVRTIGTAIAAI